MYDTEGYFTGVTHEFGGKTLPKFSTRTPPPSPKDDTLVAKYCKSTDTWSIVEKTTTPVVEDEEHPTTTEEDTTVEHSTSTIDSDSIATIRTELSSITSNLKTMKTAVDKYKEEHVTLKSTLVELQKQLETLRKKLTYKL